MVLCKKSSLYAPNSNSSNPISIVTIVSPVTPVSLWWVYILSVYGNGVTPTEAYKDKIEKFSFYSPGNAPGTIMVFQGSSNTGIFSVTSVTNTQLVYKGEGGHNSPGRMDVITCAIV